MSRRSSASGFDAAAAQSLGLSLFLIIVMVIVGCYVAYKAFELVVRMIVLYPRHKVLWSVIAVFLVSLFLALVTLHSFFGALTLVSFVLLLGTCKVMEIYYDTLMQAPLTGERLIDDALHHPWWTDASFAQTATPINAFEHVA